MISTPKISISKYLFLYREYVVFRYSLTTESIFIASAQLAIMTIPTEILKQKRNLIISQSEPNYYFFI
jgi:hypothetical protein